MSPVSQKEYPVQTTHLGGYGGCFSILQAAPEFTRNLPWLLVLPVCLRIPCELWVCLFDSPPKKRERERENETSNH